MRVIFYRLCELNTSFRRALNRRRLAQRPHTAAGGAHRRIALPYLADAATLSELGAIRVRKESQMKHVIVAAIVCAFSFASAAQAATCKSTAAEKNLHGAALTSFMKKCESDAQKTCD